MKILFITHYSDLYGANRSMLNLIDGLKNQVEAIVLSPKDGLLIEELKKRNISYFIQEFYPWIYIKRWGLLKMPYKIIKNIIALYNLKEELKRYNPDIIYSNSSVISMGYLVSFYLKKRHIVHVREFGDLDYNIKFDFGRCGVNYFLSNTAAVVSISKAINRIIPNKTKGKKYIIYNGIISRYLLKKEPKELSKKTITFSIIGLLTENKNQIEAIRAFKLFNNKIPDSRLYIAGDGLNEKYISLLKEESGDLIDQNKIIFTGYISNVDNLLNETDILLMCSKNEGMGRVTVEAMAWGIPTIGFNGGATPELIEDGVNGLLYTGDYINLSKKMITLGSDSSTYSKFSLNCLKKVEENFTVERYAKDVHSVLQHVLHQKN